MNGERFFLSAVVGRRSAKGSDTMNDERAAS